MPETFNQKLVRRAKELIIESADNHDRAVKLIQRGIRWHAWRMEKAYQDAKKEMNDGHADSHEPFRVPEFP